MRKNLYCKSKQKRSILAEIRSGGEAWLSAHPDAPFSEFEKAFGSPQSVATAQLEQMAPSELLTKLAAKQRLIRLTVVVAAAILLMWSCAVLWAIIEHHQAVNGQLKMIFEGTERIITLP